MQRIDHVRSVNYMHLTYKLRLNIFLTITSRSIHGNRRSRLIAIAYQFSMLILYTCTIARTFAGYASRKRSTCANNIQQEVFHRPALVGCKTLHARVRRPSKITNRMLGKVQRANGASVKIKTPGLIYHTPLSLRLPLSAFFLREPEFDNIKGDP